MENQDAISKIWAVAHFLVTNKGYQLLHIQKKEEHVEGIQASTVHLIKKVGKEYRYIRLALSDFVWSSVVERNVKEIAATAELFRKKLRGSKMEGLNIYFFPDKPMSDVQGRIEQFGKVRIGEATYLQSVCVDLEPGIPLNQTESYHYFDFSKEEFVELLQQESQSQTFYAQDLLERDQVKNQELRKLFMNKRPIMTYLFLGVILFMFLLLTLNGGSENSETLIRFGAKYNPLILQGEWWRLASAMFLHIGFIHLAFNSIALFYLGTAVERMYGSIRFLMIYLLSGLAGSLASFIFSDSISAGASGAIFGLFGALLYFGTIRKDLFFQTFGKEILTILALNLVIGLIIPSIDLYGHLGGLLGGYLAAAAVGLPRLAKQRILQGLAFLLLIILLAGGWIFGSSYVGEREYYQLYQAERLLFEEKNYPEAEQLLLNLENRKNENPDVVYYYLAVAQINQNKVNAGKENLEKAIQVKSDFIEALLVLAEIAIYENQTDQARKYLDQILQVNPNHEQAKRMLDKINP